MCSVQIFPAPCPSRAPIGLAPEPVLLLMIGLITEKIEPALSGQAGGERGGLPGGTRFVQSAQQVEDGVRVVEGDAGGERGGLLGGARLIQGAQQAAETSCETGNRWLDRAMVVDLPGDGLAFRVR
jgi:hypothetical protein